MHELSICHALLLQVERVAGEQGAGKVTAIVLRVGPLSGVEPELLCRAYPLAAAGTIAADARLEILKSDVLVRCSQCGHETTVTANRLLCGHCGDFRTRLVRGDEMTLQSLELEKPHVPRNTHANQKHRRLHGAL